MKSVIFAGFLLLQFFCACHSHDKQPAIPTSENDADAARNFIDATLKGHLDIARSMLLNDSVNMQYFDVYERIYKTRMDPEDKRGYREASINIHAIRPLNDSASVVTYSNSYKKQNDSLKVILRNGAWMVDFKYSFPQTDSLP